MGILICGLNGAGKSTLGKPLADRLGYTFIDNEDLYFSQEDPAYKYARARSKEEAVRLLEERIKDDRRFVFAAVKGDYGEKLIDALDCIILVNAPKEVRKQRVRERSFLKFGRRMLPGGDLFEREQNWFSVTDSRPDDYVLSWLESIDRPVISVDGTLPADDNVRYLMTVLK